MDTGNHHCTLEITTVHWKSPLYTGSQEALCNNERLPTNLDCQSRGQEMTGSRDTKPANSTAGKAEFSLFSFCPSDGFVMA